MRTYLPIGLWLALIPGICGLHPLAAQEPGVVPDALSPGDALLVRIDNLGGGLPEYREIVDTDGQVELPYLGFVRAAGKSLVDLQLDMAQAYAKAGLSSNAAVRLTYITHFEPPPARTNLVRIQDPRQPVAATPPPGQP